MSMLGSIFGGLGLGLNKQLQDAQQARKLRDQQINQLLLSGLQRTRQPQGEAGVGSFFEELLAPAPLDPTEFQKPFKPEQISVKPGETIYQTQEGGGLEKIAEGTPEAFTLGPGQVRYDTTGKIIAQVGDKPHEVKLAESKGKVYVIDALTGEKLHEYGKGEVGWENFQIKDVQNEDGTTSRVAVGIDQNGQFQTTPIPQLTEHPKPRTATEILKDLENVRTSVENGTVDPEVFGDKIKMLNTSLTNELMKNITPEARQAIFAEYVNILQNPSTPSLIKQWAVMGLTKLESLGQGPIKTLTSKREGF